MNHPFVESCLTYNYYSITIDHFFGSAMGYGLFFAKDKGHH